MHTLSTMRRDMIKIETYWNVNKIITAIVSVFTAIKIETYWNVNNAVINCSYKVCELK